MWFRNRIDPSTGISIRHLCNQWDHGLKRYSWLKHDFDSFGIQEIKDDGVSLETSFVVHDEHSWSSRILVESEETSSIILYVALDDQASFPKNETLDIEGKLEFPLNPDSDLDLKGWSNSLGDFKARISVKSGQVVLKSFLATHSSLVNLQETVTRNLGVTRDKLIVLRGTQDEEPNFIAHQIVVKGKAVLRMDFVSGDELSSMTEVQEISLEESLERKAAKFSQDFERNFRLKSKGFSGEEISFAEAMVSNMVGGVGFFSGFNLVSSQDSQDSSSKALKYGPHALLSAVPSRSFFPRGFLWDEGFHHLLISRMIPNLSFNAIKSWLSLMNIDGWIPREVILGSEAESRVPKDFLVQKTLHANPPTFFLALESMMDQGLLFQQDLTILFPRLQAWFKWFNETQSGEKSYRWRSRDLQTKKELNPKTLASGLDDFPRPSHPSGQEYHVDLRCWMTVASRVMTRISSLLRHESHSEYKETRDFLEDNSLLDSLHWSDEHAMYCDFGMHTREVYFVKNAKTNETERHFPEEPSFSCVNEFGYVSLFPLLLQVLSPENPRLEKVMKDLRNPSLLWTDYGLRSLSPTAFFYDKYNTEADPPYWRSHVWLNINYLALKSLFFYKETKGPFSGMANQVYTELRNNLIKNVLKEYRETGYLWENYSDKTGRGQGSRPFTGWSALIVLILAEKY